MPNPEDKNPVVPEEKPMQLATKKQLLDRLGNSGTFYFSGYFNEEYNPDWTDISRIEIIEKMRRQDGVIQGILQAVKSPLKGTHWYVQPAGDDESDQLIAEEVEKQIFNMPNRGFLEFLREALAFLDFGHYVFEKIWYIRDDGKIALRDLAPRIPHSILNWRTTDNKKGITQYIRNDSMYEQIDPVGSDSTVNSAKTYSIPFEKLLIFTHNKEGDDYTGISLLRAAYSHWFFKNKIYKIQAVAIERMGAGLPTVEFDPAKTGQAEKDAMKKALENLYANEAAYLMFPNSMKFDFATPKASSMQGMIDETIKHHNRMIMMSVLAEFLDLGGGDTGSLALSQDQSSFFLQSLEDIARYFCEEFNRNVVKEIVDLNFGKQEKYPTLAFAPLGTIDYQEMSGVLSTLSAAGMLEADPEMLQFIRKLFRFPELSEEKIEKMNAEANEKELATLEADADFTLPEETPVEEEPAMEPDDEVGMDETEIGEDEDEPNVDESTV